MGTVINCAAIIAGGVLGILFGRFIPERMQETILKANGAAVIILGLAGTLSRMLKINGADLEVTGTMTVILSICLGALLGELADLEGKMEQFGGYLKEKTGSQADPRFIEGFLSASLTVCIGAMAIVGAIQDGIAHDISVLSAKAVLDFVIILVMAASMGKGCLFSFVPVGLWQGGITLLSSFLKPVFSEPALAAISMVGNVLIFLVGVNLLFGKTIRVANLLPSLIFAVVFTYIPGV
jgi:uncharacterized membrane protein YqgA involved in biofilm formation